MHSRIGTKKTARTITYGKAFSLPLDLIVSKALLMTASEF